MFHSTGSGQTNSTPEQTYQYYTDYGIVNGYFVGIRPFPSQYLMAQGVINLKTGVLMSASGQYTLDYDAILQNVITADQ